MKKAIKIIIIFLISFIVISVHAEDLDDDPPTSEDSDLSIQLNSNMDEYQKALVEVAKQYFYRGKNVLYNQNSYFKEDHMFLGRNLQEEGIRNWALTPFSPEDAIEGNREYSTCSDYIYQIMKEAFCLELLPIHLHTTGMLTKTYKEEYNPSLSDEERKQSLVPYYYEISGNETEAQITEQLNKIQQILEVGDIINIRRSSSTGHAVLYVGTSAPSDTNYTNTNAPAVMEGIHPEGIKDIYNYGTKLPPDANHGTVNVTPASTFFDPSTSHYMFYNNQETNSRITSIIIIRPLVKVRNNEIENSACFEEAYNKTKNRLKYSDLVINKTSSLNRFETASPCENITYTVTLENKSDTNYTIPVNLEVPEYTSLIKGDIEQDITLNAKETKKIQYTVKVDSSKENYGKYIKNTGSIGGIKLNTLTNKIENKLTNAEENYIKKYIENNTFSSTIEMISKIYENLYNDTSLKNLTPDSFINSVLIGEKNSNDITEYTLKQNDSSNLNKMAVENLYGGYLVSNSTIDGWFNRPKDVLEKDLQIGDILTVISYEGTYNRIYTTPWNKNIYLYIGDHTLATIENNRLKRISISDDRKTSSQLISSLFGEVAFTVHRPSIVHNKEINSCEVLEENIPIPNTKMNSKKFIIIISIILLVTGISIITYNMYIKNKNYI